MADGCAEPKVKRMPRKRFKRIASATPRVIYYDTPVPRDSGTVYLLTPHDVARLRSMEARNRLRVRKDIEPSVAEEVDFIAVCIRQEWLCCICKTLMDPSLKGAHKRAISVEHDPALSVCNEHSARTVFAAHVACNVKKGHGSDTPRAAKIKRVTKAEQRHVARIEAKATLGHEAYKRQRRAEMKIKGRPLASRGFDRTKTRGFDGKVRTRG